MWVRPKAQAYAERDLRVAGGEVATRYYAADNTQLAVIWVGGVGGGWDSPAEGLYPKLSEELTEAGISSLRIRFRNPHSLRDAVVDVQAGIDFLQSQDTSAIALVGHSLGGAVVIQAAAHQPNVRTVVALSTQSYGTDSVAQLAPRCSILLVHGVADDVLPWRSSAFVHRLAKEPRRMVLIPDAGHVLDEAASEVQTLVRDWIVKELAAAQT
jgi:hypothetical protein